MKAQKEVSEVSRTCRACREDAVEQTIDFGSWPIVHHLKREITDPRECYEFAVGVCNNCGLLQLLNPISAEILYKEYFTLSAWKNNPHIDRLKWLVGECSGVERSSRVLEIGCNDGSFLTILKEQGYDSLFGIEPSEDAYLVAKRDDFDVEHSFFGLDKAQEIRETRGAMDLVVCRQVLEHVADLPDFVEGLNHVLAPGAPLLLEVPDASTNISDLDYGFWEEHVNYFTEDTLKGLLSSFGFQVSFSEKVVFSGSTIIVLAFKSEQGRQNKFDTDRAATNVEIDGAKRMGELWPTFRHQYRAYIEETRAENKGVAIYGCGARSSTLANFLGLDDLVSCYIDDQSEKQKFFVPGNNLEILPRKAMGDLGIRKVLLGVNAENENKVILNAGLREANVTWSSMLAPSRYLPAFWLNLAGRFR